MERVEHSGAPSGILRFVPVLAVLILCVLVLGAVQAGHNNDNRQEPAADKEQHGHPKDSGKPEAKKGETKKEPNALSHTLDAEELHFFQSFGPQHVHLPNIFGFQITKYMILEVIAALLVIAVYVPMARRLQSGAPPRGAWDNFFDVLVTFIRDQVARPSLGPKDADKFVPFLWTLFLFILFNNLLGMVPFGGSATGSIYVTAGLAFIVFFAIHGSAIMKMGREPAHAHGHDDEHEHGHEHDAGHHSHMAEQAETAGGLGVFFVGLGRYVSSIWPKFDVPFPLGLFIKPLIFVLEIVGVLVRNAVLAVRLFANMFAGHMVLATLLIFIYAASQAAVLLWATVTVASIVGIVALSLLELFVAFLQAFIFVFLTSLFMGMAMNPEH